MDSYGFRTEPIIHVQTGANRQGDSALYLQRGLGRRSPAAGLIWDGKGNLYSTTKNGGDLGSSNPSCSGIGCGVVFKLTP
jgi:hypothetical protein